MTPTIHFERARRAFVQLLPVVATAAPGLHAQFGAPRELTEACPIAQEAILVDLDGDGDLDALTTSLFLQLVAWFENDGLGSFGRRHVIATSPVNTVNTSATLPVDVDGDGVLDVIWALNDGTVSWLRGIGGGAFAPPAQIATFPGAFGAFPVRGTIDAADLDLDGDADIVYGLLSGGLYVQRNLGAGVLAAPVLVTATNEDVGALELRDLTGDLLPELVYGSHRHERITWLENLGGFAFGAGTNVGSGLVRPSEVRVEDMDADGDVDLVVAAEGADRLVWFENLGAGAFGPERLLASEVRPWRFTFVDVDLDLDRDLVVAHGHLAGLVWYERIAGSTFGAARTIAGGVPVEAAGVGDVDGDGRPDVLASASDSLGTYRNTGGAPLFAPPVALGTATLEVKCVAAGDLDGDGDADLLAASSADRRLTWFEQLGGGSFGPLSVIDGDCADCSLVRAADVDRDGWTDVVYVAGDLSRVYLKRNQGGTLGARQQIAGLGLDVVGDIELGDLDGDGDLDLVAAAGDVHVVRNLGTTFAAPITLPAAFNAARVELGDLAGNALPDIVALEYWPHGSSPVRFHRNLGGFSFASPVDIAQTDFGADLALADMDSDGDLDPTWITSLPRRVYWAANHGNSTFGPLASLGLLPDYGVRLQAVDLDSDGDRDLLVGLSYDDDLLWYERLPGAFAPLRQVVLGGFVTYTTDVADFDGDGDLDVAFGSLDSDSVHWLPADFDSPIGAVACGPGELNSMGAPGVIFATGSAQVTANDLVLTGRQLPVGAFGYFLTSLTPSAPTPVAGSAGNICLGGSIGRLIAPGQVLQASPTGTVRLVLGTQSLPQGTGPTPVTPGQTWHFQLWHRDLTSAGASNFSNAIRVLFF